MRHARPHIQITWDTIGLEVVGTVAGAIIGTRRGGSDLADGRNPGRITA